MKTRPIEALLDANVPRTLRTLIFPGFFRALPLVARERIAVQSQSRNCTATGPGLFLHCYAVTTGESEKVQARLDDFRNQYGFARNMTFSMLCVSLFLFIAHHLHRPDARIRWAPVALLLAVGMLYRYLKFYRQYTYELLLRYCELRASTQEGK